jgi:hypothetical protein
MVTTVSIIKNNAKITKKFIFSNPIFGFPEFRIGFKSTNDIPIFKQVIIKKVFPTLSMLFSFTNIKIKIIKSEQTKKKL